MLATTCSIVNQLVLFLIILRSATLIHFLKPKISLLWRKRCGRNYSGSEYLWRIQCKNLDSSDYCALWFTTDEHRKLDFIVMSQEEMIFIGEVSPDLFLFNITKRTNYYNFSCTYFVIFTRNGTTYLATIRQFLTFETQRMNQLNTFCNF